MQELTHQLLLSSRQGDHIATFAKPTMVSGDANADYNDKAIMEDIGSFAVTNDAGSLFLAVTKLKNVNPCRLSGLTSVTLRGDRDLCSI